MAFLHRPTATLTYTLVDETGSRATVAFDVPYATLAAAAIAAADALALLIRALTGCAVLSYSLTYSIVDNVPLAPDAGSRVERKGVFIFLTQDGKKVKYSIPGIISGVVLPSGRIDDDDVSVAAFTTAVVAAGAIFSDSNGVDITALDQAYEAYRRSTRRMLPSDRRPD
jgi:hypothetical protein